MQREGHPNQALNCYIFIRREGAPGRPGPAPLGGVRERLFRAKGAVFIVAWGSAPGMCLFPESPALKARFT
jgi:hypothetical protein